MGTIPTSGPQVAKFLCGTLLSQVNYEVFDRVSKKPVKIDQQTAKNPLKLMDNENYVISKVQKGSVDYDKLVKEYKNSGKKWTDPQFPPDSSSIGDAQLNYVPKWERIPNVIKDAQFKVNKIQPDDIMQGGLGDCYLLSALAALAQKQQRINNLFPDLNSHHDTGIYMVKIKHGGVKRQVVVDDFIPINQYGQPSFVQPHGIQFWPLIIQKAWAKLHGSYGNIIGGLPHQCLNALSSAPTFYHQLKKPQTQQQIRKLQDIWSQLVQGENQDWPMCCGTKGDQSVTKFGLVPGHAYTLLGAYELNVRGMTQKLVKLRNPWGKRQWNGKCSDQDRSFWSGVNQTDKRKMGYSVKDQGIFFMTWNDFLNYYDMVDICKFNQSFSYNFQKFTSNKKNAVFYQINTKKRGKAFISLHQEDNRGQPQYIKQLGYARSTIIIAKQNMDNSLQWVDGLMEDYFSDQQLQTFLQEGKYIVYAKLDWIKTEKDDATISLYFQDNATIAPCSQPKDYLHKVLMDYARKSDKKSFQSQSNQDWILNQLLYSNGGFGIIAASTQNMKINLSASQKQFNQNGFVLKRPLKGKGQIELTAEPGKPFILLARVARNINPQKIRFPPKSIKLTKSRT